MNLRKVDIGKLPDGKNAYEIVERWIHNVLNQKLDLLTVLIIGSRAEGKWEPWSDIDLVAIFENLPDNLDRWSDFIFDDTPFIESRIYTKEEFLKALEELDLTALEAMHHGLLIYDKGFYNEARKKFDEVVKNGN